MVVFGWLITFTYSAQQPRVFLSSPTMVPITPPAFLLCSDAEVVPLRSKSFLQELGVGVSSLTSTPPATPEQVSKRVLPLDKVIMWHKASGCGQVWLFSNAIHSKISDSL